MVLPEKTVQRLSRYRRLLSKYQYLEEPYIFSHDLARLLNINPVQVRRDLMLIGSTGNNRKGYSVVELIDMISKAIDPHEGLNIAVVGFGKLGQAICKYLSDSHGFQDVVAAFDIDADKINKTFNGVTCYDISKIPQVLRQRNVTTAIMTIPDDYAKEICRILVDCGVKGLLNFTSVKLNVPDGVFVRDFDIITSLEVINYFGCKPS